MTVHAQIEHEDYGLSAIATLALYRIIQEPVVNAARHVRVSDATVTLRSEGERVIGDSGRGRRVQVGTGRRSVGPIGIRERTAPVRGTVTVESSPG